MYLKHDSKEFQRVQAWEVTTQMSLKVLKLLGTIMVSDDLLDLTIFLKWLFSSIWNGTLVANFSLLWLPWFVWQQGGSQADSTRRVFFGQTIKGMSVEAKRLKKKEQKDKEQLE